MYITETNENVKKLFEKIDGLRDVSKLKFLIYIFGLLNNNQISSIINENNYSKHHSPKQVTFELKKKQNSAKKILLKNLGYRKNYLIKKKMKLKICVIIKKIISKIILIIQILILKVGKKVIEKIIQMVF